MGAGALAICVSGAARGWGRGWGRGEAADRGRDGENGSSRGGGVAACKTGLGELQTRRPGLLLCCEGCFCKFLRSVMASYML